MEIIPGGGYDQADLMIVADYARKADAASGQCLSGYYLRKLNELMSDTGIKADQTYRTAIVKEYLIGLGVGSWAQDKKILQAYYTENPVSIEYYLNIIIEEINLIKPTVILALGEYALRILTGKEGIAKWRGSVLPILPEIHSKLEQSVAPRVVIAKHPMILAQQEEEVFIMRMDFDKAVKLTFTPNKIVDDHEIVIARDFGSFLNFRGRYPDHPERMVTDVETHYGFITCASVSYDGNVGCTIPLIGASKVEPLDKARMMYLLAKDLEDPLIIKGNQNINYDQHQYERLGMQVTPIKWDTMLAAHTIAAEFPKNLGFLTSIYTDLTYHKDEGKEFDPSKHSFDQLYSYCAKDSIATFRIWDGQIKDLKELELLEFFEDFVMKLYHLYYDSEGVGIKISTKKRDELLAKYESLYNLKYLELKAITGQDINMNAPAQIGRYMESKGFPVFRHKTNTGNLVISTDAESLKKMIIANPEDYNKCEIQYNHALRFINLVLLIRRIDKVIEYIKVGIHPDGRVHTSVRISGTTTSRTSNGQTADGIPEWYLDKDRWKIDFKQLGQSFQTVTKHGFIVDEEDELIEDGIIGKDLREMYITDDGWVLIEADGSQAEARVCDVLGEDWDSLEEYNKFDKHCKTASMIFTEHSYEDILRMAKKEHTDEGIFMRNIGKHSKHAKNNGMDAYEFAKRYLHTASMRESITKAKKILQAIDRAYPKIENVFHAEVEKALRDTRTLVSARAFEVPCGRKRIFYKKITKHYLNVAFSQIPQSTISDHTKAAALRVRAQVNSNWARMVAENHDSITYLIRRGFLRRYVGIVKKELERPIDFRQCSLSRDYDLIIPCEISIGRKTWGKMKDLKLKKLRLN